MTTREAMTWLDDVMGRPLSPTAQRDYVRAAEIKSMLAQPRLPDELSPELIEAIWNAGNTSSHRDYAHAVLKAIRDWVTRPSTVTHYSVNSTDPLPLADAMVLAGQFLERGGTVIMRPVEVKA